VRRPRRGPKPSRATRLLVARDGSVATHARPRRAAPRWRAARLLACVRARQSPRALRRRLPATHGAHRQARALRRRTRGARGAPPEVTRAQAERGRAGIAFLGVCWDNLAKQGEDARARAAGGLLSPRAPASPGRAALAPGHPRSAAKAEEGGEGKALQNGRAL